MRILYAEDEHPLSMAITEILKMSGFIVDPVYDGKEAIEFLDKGAYDAVILDIMMPKASGIEVLSYMRSNADYTPVMLLTAKAEVDDRIEGLAAGADDYLGKPFVAKELIARLSAMIRRSTKYVSAVQSLGNITLHADTGELRSDVTSLRLSSGESKLLSLLLQSPKAVFTAEEIQGKIFPEETDTGIVTLYVSYLQGKLTQLRSSFTIVQGESGYGLEERI